ncbi:unnamed protein product [Cuscuta campestris]|uniref:Uncharacterized protein n=1 Tax=Cuscuta campestris TaxID=132261 RepID=A0A484NNY1_9ASTE|nr:unnamed protein product [Cuscuta campestris]
MPGAKDSAENAGFIFRIRTFIIVCVDYPSRTPSLKKSATNTFTVTLGYASMDSKGVQQKPPEISDSNSRHIIRYLCSFIPFTITTSASLILELEDTAFGSIWKLLIGS